MTREMAKKLNELIVDNLEQELAFHQIDKFRIEKVIDTWANVFSSFASSFDQYFYIFVELDTYSIMNLVFIFFVKSLGLSSCTKVKH